MNKKEAIFREPSMNMIIDTIDIKDQVIGVIKRADVIKSFKSFRVVHVFVFNKKGELLIQKTSSKNKRYPFHWGSSVAGYLFAGESYKKGAIRRMQQELGVIPSSFDFFDKTVMNEETGKKMIGLYVCQYDKELYPNAELILETKFYSIEKIKGLLHSENMQFTPTFRHLFNFFYTKKNL